MAGQGKVRQSVRVGTTSPDYKTYVITKLKPRKENFSTDG